MTVKFYAVPKRLDHIWYKWNISPVVTNNGFCWFNNKISTFDTFLSVSHRIKLPCHGLAKESDLLFITVKLIMRKIIASGCILGFLRIFIQVYWFLLKNLDDYSFNFYPLSTLYIRSRTAEQWKPPIRFSKRCLQCVARYKLYCIHSYPKQIMGSQTERWLLQSKILVVHTF